MAIRRELLEDHLRRTLGNAIVVKTLTPLGGGSINAVYRALTNHGTFVIKSNDLAQTDIFEREAEGLLALKAACEILTVPSPIGWSDPGMPGPAFLVLEDLVPAAPVQHFDETFGRGLAELHRATAPAFGFEHDNYCGATPQRNTWTEAWATFYAEHRLRHLLELAEAKRGVSARDRIALEALLELLPDLIDDAAPPSLIHGDLWSGNLHNANGHPALIDPAAYYGHREAELGMMQLFGGFSARVWDAYAEAAPLRRGWRERLSLYELYHVLNHYVLFGGAYGAQAFSIVRRWI